MRNPRCVITFPVPASGRALESWASLGLLHDLHESAGVEDLQVPLGERRPEFVPANHFDPLVSAFRELDPVRAFYAAWSKPLLLRLLNGGFDAHRFHDQVNPSGTRPHNRPLTDASRGQYIIVVRTRSSRETFYRGALCRNMVRFGSSGIRGLGNVDEAQQREVEEALDRSRFMAPTWDRIGAVFSRSDLVQQHIDTIIKDVGTAKARVVVDCGCGATSTITPFLLRQLGCDVLAINAQADGHFPGREPEPTEENLAALRATVPAVHADLGIAHDGDGDRMVAVDRTGTFVGGDLLLALFARKEVRSGLVVPVDASMVLEDLLPKAKVWRTRVGDVYVAAELKRRGADFGGEPSGTWIFPKATLCPDGVYAAARLVALVGERPLDELVREIPRYPVIRGTVSYRASKRAAIEAHLDLALRDSGAEVSTVDGWRLQFNDGWALVRFSGTEPKIRLLAESREEARAKEIYSAVLSSAKGAAA